MMREIDQQIKHSQSAFNFRPGARRMPRLVQWCGPAQCIIVTMTQLLFKLEQNICGVELLYGYSVSQIVGDKL